jgi:lysozyme
MATRPSPPKGAPKTLVAVLGLTAATLLMTSIPADESGRKVEVMVQPDGQATIRHISGKQYLRAYLDIAGIPTACDGITRGVKMGMTFTEAQCTAMLERELIAHAEGVMQCTPALHRPGMDYQRFASVSMAYNIGVANYCGSTARKRLDAGSLRDACDAMLLWNKVTIKGVKVVSNGLVKRRNRERQACLTGLPGYPPATLTKRMEAFR